MCLQTSRCPSWWRKTCAALFTLRGSAARRRDVISWRAWITDLASHVRTVSSQEPEAIKAPSGEKATDNTPLVCPFMTLIAFPDLASHVRTVQSVEPDAIIEPSGEKATELTGLV